MSIDQSMHSLFGVSKVAADVLVQEYGRYFGMKTVCFRGGCLTGPSHSGTALHGFLAYLMKCTATGARYQVFGYAGKQVRDNIHSEDLVSAFWHFFQNPGSAEVYNMGGGRDCNCSMLEAIEICQAITGRRLDWSYSEDNRAGDHIWWISDTRRFRRAPSRLVDHPRRARDPRGNLSGQPPEMAGRGHRRFCELFSLQREKLHPGMTFRDVVDLCVATGNHPGKTVDELIEERRSVGDHTTGTHFVELAGNRVVVSVHRPTSDGGFVATYEDVTERRQAEKRIAYMARHDALTGLPNRLVFGERVDQAIADMGRGSGFAVLSVDVDHFKQVNDTLGHPIGDELLRAIAERLQSCVREVDTVGRLGGDEFAIVQRDVKQPEDAALLARRIIEIAGAPYDINGHRVTIGISLGISLAPGRRLELREAAEELRRRALPRQVGRPRHLALLRAGNGRPPAGPPRARARPARSADRQPVRAVLPADL